jgi:hypothetical protein
MGSGVGGIDRLGGKRREETTVQHALIISWKRGEGEEDEMP